MAQRGVLPIMMDGASGDHERRGRGRAVDARSCHRPSTYRGDVRAHHAANAGERMRMVF